MTIHSTTKRDFLKQLFKVLTIVWGGFIFWTLKNYLFFRPDSNTSAIGKFSQFRKNQIIHNKMERLFLVRDTHGLYTVSDTCTHRGCMLRVEENRLVCPCHSGIFELNGQPVSGPVNKPLDHYYIYKCKQDLLAVDATQIVNRDFRYLE